VVVAVQPRPLVGDLRCDLLRDMLVRGNLHTAVM